MARPDGHVLESVVQDEFEEYIWNFPVLLQTALIHEAHHLLVLREGQLDPENVFWGQVWSSRSKCIIVVFKLGLSGCTTPTNMFLFGVSKDSFEPHH